MRIFRESRRWFASLLALALIVLIGTEPIRAQVVTVGGGGTWSGGAITTASSFLDGANFQLKNAADPTKILQFDVTGVTTGNTITPFGFGGTAAAPTVNYPNGVVGTPGLQPANGNTTGLWSRSAGVQDFSAGGVWMAELSSLSGSAGVVVNQNGRICFATGTSATNACDTILTRGGAAAKWQMGLDLNGAAIAQTVASCNGITGTDVAGCDHIEAAGKGTGAGAPGDHYIKTAKDLATGTTAQTLFDRHFYRGKAKALTESSATTFVTINNPTTLTYVGGEVRYCIFAVDATVPQARCGDVDFAVVNAAGTVTCSALNLLGTEATAIPSGTLTNTFTFVLNGTSCDMKANAVSSLTQTTLEIAYSVEMHGLGTVTP